MKYKTVALVILIFLTACKKDKLHVDYIPVGTEVKYKITLSHDTIKELITYSDNKLISTKQYLFNGPTAEIITKNANGIVTEKSVYLIGSNGYAESSIDSSFSDTGTFAGISISAYEYQNGFLTRHSVDTGKNVYTYTIIDNNIASSNVAFPGWQSGCTDYYSYGAYLTTIDVRNFKNNLLGKPGNNLITHASWENGCPCGPSSNPASSDFEYEFNNSGYVTKMKNYYIPCYHAGTTNLTGTVSTTIYEY